MEQKEPRVADVLAWNEALRDKGVIPRPTAQLRDNGTRKVLRHCFGPEFEALRISQVNFEKKTLRPFERWAIEDPTSGITASSAKSYISSAKSLLKNYLEYLEDPVGWEPQRGPRGTRIRKRKKETEATTTDMTTPASEAPVSTEAPAPPAESVPPPATVVVVDAEVVGDSPASAKARASIRRCHGGTACVVRNGNEHLFVLPDTLSENDYGQIVLAVQMALGMTPAVEAF